MIFACALAFTLSFPAASMAQEGRPSITLDRRACFGSCPYYSIAIFADGRVVYLGVSSVAVTGRIESAIPPDVVNRLIKKAVGIHFFDLKDDYSNCRNPDGSLYTLTDLSATYVTLLLDGKTKRIRDYICAPDELVDFEREIERDVNSTSGCTKTLCRVQVPSPQMFSAV